MMGKTGKLLGSLYKGSFFSRKRKPDEIAKEFLKTSYSQCGEDLIIDFIFRFILKINRPNFIDVGAFDPYFLSNTAKFYEEGCFGINIEPNPEQFKAFEYYRPQSVNLNIGVGLQDGTLDYHMYKDPYLNSFESNNRSDKPLKVLPVAVKPLAQIVKDHFQNKEIDLLSVDTEGFDLDVIKSLDIARNRPKVICVETLEEKEDGDWKTNREIIEWLESHEYFAHSTTRINTIFVDNRLMKVKLV